MDQPRLAPQITIRFGAVGLLLFICDRITKYFAYCCLPREGVFLFGDAPGFALERNQGIAFSIPLPIVPLLLVIFCIVAVLIGMWLRAVRQSDNLAAWGTVLVIIGALSNAFDRLRFGYVIDFIRLTTWPTFNLSDSFIFFGVSILLVSYLLTKKHNARPPFNSSDYRS